MSSATYKPMGRAPRGGRLILAKVVCTSRTVKVRWDGRFWNEGNGEKWDSGQLLGWRDIDVTEIIIAKGTLFLLSEVGEEDGEGVVAVLKALRDIWTEEVLQECMKEAGITNVKYLNTPNLAKWLCDRDYADAVLQFPEWRIRKSAAYQGGEVIFHGMVPR